MDRILIFRIGHLGDTLVALPAIWAVRNAYPHAKLTYLSNADPKNPHYVSARNVLPEDGLLDDWMSYPANLGRWDTAKASLKLALEIRRRRFNAVIYLMTRNRTPEQIGRDLKFFRLAGISNVIGAEYVRGNFLTTEIPKPTPEVESEGEFLLSSLRSGGIEVSDPAPPPEMLLTADEKAVAGDWLSRHFEPLSGRRLIAVAPGSKWASKIWPAERFAEVGERLIIHDNAFPVIFGGPEDRERGDALIDHWNLGVNAAGELNVREAAAALQQCELYLGNDTGTMHLAAAVGTPCVAVFAAIDWIGRWKPFGKDNVIFRKRVECEGCHTPDCFNNHKCLNLIEIDEVYKACHQVLKRH